MIIEKSGMLQDCVVIVQNYNITNTGLNIYATLITNSNEPINNVST